MDLKRSCGILLHPTSLPGPWGIGDLGAEAYRFVDFLNAAAQSWWQVLPLGPTGYGNSPYMCFSAFAGNPYLVSPERLVEADLLSSSDLERCPSFPRERVDYGSVIGFKMALLAKAHRRFKSVPSHFYRDSLAKFCEKNGFWLEDYALFMALKEAHRGRVWTAWEEALAKREPAALKKWRAKLRDATDFHKFIQYLFFEQWASLRDYCRSNGIGIIGDMPIYVAHDSAEVWAHPEMFCLDARGHPSVVAGVPPDYFSATGQRWGNPIYRWDVMAQSGYQWWIERCRICWDWGASTG